MDARSVQFQQQLQEKDDEINRLRRELRVRNRNFYILVLSAQTHVYYALLVNSEIGISLAPQSLSLKHAKCTLYNCCSCTFLKV